jgi:hypothetical protein
LLNMNVPAVFKQAPPVALLPPQAQAVLETHRIIVSRKLQVTVGSQLCNYTQVRKYLLQEPLLPGQRCACQQYITSDAQCDADTHCVRTADLSIVRHPQLRELMQHGTKFRAYEEEDPGGALDACADTLVDNLAKKAHLQPQQLAGYAAA